MCNWWKLKTWKRDSATLLRLLYATKSSYLLLLLGIAVAVLLLAVRDEPVPFFGFHRTLLVRVRVAEATFAAHRSTAHDTIDFLQILGNKLKWFYWEILKKGKSEGLPLLDCGQSGTCARSATPSDRCFCPSEWRTAKFGHPPVSATTVRFGWLLLELETGSRNAVTRSNRVRVTYAKNTTGYLTSSSFPNWMARFCITLMYTVL